MSRLIITNNTIKRLFAQSGNRCAFPGCTAPITSRDDDLILAHICHIEAVEPGGARYNPDSNDDERRNFANLILLCPNHHKEVDNDVTKYTVDYLKNMKRVHESKQSQHEKIRKNPSILNTVIKYIGEQIFENPADEPLIAPDAEEKILYNNIMRYKFVIEEYSLYQGKLNKLYDEIEKQGSMKKENILRITKRLYLEEKGKYISLEKVRANADDIIDSIKNKLWDIMENSSNFDPNLDYGAIDDGLLIILVDAFMRCDILEGPPKK